MFQQETRRREKLIRGRQAASIPQRREICWELVFLSGYQTAWTELCADGLERQEPTLGDSVRQRFLAHFTYGDTYVLRLNTLFQKCENPRFYR